MKRVLFPLVSAALGLGAMAVAVELALPRIVPAQYVTYHFWGNRPTTLLPGVEHRAITRDFDTRFRANSLGFNDREHGRAKPAGRVRVLLLGDSVVEAVQVRPEQHLARLLEARAAREGRDLEVIAMGIAGQGQSHQLANYLALGRALEPDVVASFFCANDLWNNVAPEPGNDGRPIYVSNGSGDLVSSLEGRAEIPPSAAELDSHARRSRRGGLRVLARLVRMAARLLGSDAETRRAARAAALYELPPDEARHASPGGPSGVRADQQVMFEKLVAKLADEVVEKDGHRLLAVITSGNLRHEPGARFREMLEWVKATYAREGAEVLDLETRLRARALQEQRYPSWKRDAHWNAVGHAWVADLLYAELPPRPGS